MKFSHSASLEVIDLGRADYVETTDYMLELVNQIVNKGREDCLLVAEFDSVLTVGRGARISPYLELDIPVHEVSRGGKVTYHGPGQLVVYPLLSLKGQARDLHAYLYALEESIINTMAEFGLEGTRDSRNTGCWVNSLKIASIGVAVRKWVTYHGLALNVATDLNQFNLFDPCGLDSNVMTNMQQQLCNPDLTLEEVKPVAIKAIREMLIN
jgi:lipoyl(octanoyl) transferase